MSYLTHAPAHITAVDLNGAHVALNRLKLAAVQHLPDHDAFFVSSVTPTPRERRGIRPLLAPISMPSRAPTGRAAPSPAAGASSALPAASIAPACSATSSAPGTPWRGCSAPILAACWRPDAGRAARHLRARARAAVRSRLVRWLVDRPASLYGLGIPPAQYEALAGDRPWPTSCAGASSGWPATFPSPTTTLRSRPWAGAIRTDARQRRCRPISRPRISRRARHAGRVAVRHMSFTDFLVTLPHASLDRYVLLDAQDWMTDRDLTRLWTQITRTARPGARVIFRTAAPRRFCPAASRRTSCIAGPTRPTARRSSARRIARRSMAASISTCARTEAAMAIAAAARPPRWMASTAISASSTI